MQKKSLYVAQGNAFLVVIIIYLLFLKFYFQIQESITLN